MAESASPTDNSATLTTTFSTTFDTSHSQPSSGQNLLDVTRDELERRELLHSVQLLRLEVSQKQLVIEALKTERATELEEMKEQLADAQHENKLLKLRLQSLTHAYEKEMENVRKTRVEPPLQQVLLRDIKEELEQAFDDVEISESDFNQLKGLDKSLWTTSQLVKVHCHELTGPLYRHIDDLQTSVAQLNQQISAKDSQLSHCQQRLEGVREGKAQVEGRCSSLAEELASVRALVQEGNYKINNFDALKKDRDGLRGEVDAMKKSLVEQEAREDLVKEQLEKATKECLSAQQTVVLLKQDKEYLSGQVSVLGGRVASSQEKVDHLTDQLSEAKLDRENLYKQLIADKEQCRVDYDLRLQRELDELKSRTSLHMDQLKLQTREFYDRENHSLSEARDAAIADRDRAITAEKEIQSLYQQLLKNYHSLQASSDGQCSELQAQLKITQFEKERVSIAHHETLTQLKHCQLHREKLQKKFDLLSVELGSCQREGEESVRRLEEQLVQATQRLQGYEKIEGELDDIVLQSAQLENECDAERVLFSYGFGTSIPTNSRRRLQQSVQLARRVLQLEKLNSSLRQQLSSEQSKASQLKQQLSSAENLLSKTRQPQGMMVESLRERERRVRELEGRVEQLEAELATISEEKARLIETKNLLAADLEKLLSHRQELHHMKQALVGVARKGQPLLSCDQESALHIPPPTLFTKRDRRRKDQSHNLSPSDR